MKPEKKGVKYKVHEHNSDKSFRWDISGMVKTKKITNYRTDDSGKYIPEFGE